MLVFITPVKIQSKIPKGLGKVEIQGTKIICPRPFRWSIVQLAFGKIKINKQNIQIRESLPRKTHKPGGEEGLRHDSQTLHSARSMSQRELTPSSFNRSCFAIRDF